MQQIVNVTIDENGRSIPDSKSIGLQYETGVTRYKIIPDPSWVSDQYFYYIVVSPPEDSDNKQYAVPLVNQGGTFIFEISSGITWYVGNYKFAFLAMSKELVDGQVPDDGIVGISDHWNGKITKSILDYISLQKQPEDANFQLLYTDLMALSVEVRNKANYAQEQGEYAKKTADEIIAAKEAGEFNGSDGISPIIETEENANGFKVGITDAKGKKELQLNHGISPDIVTSEDEEGFNVEIIDHKGKEEFKLNHGKSPEINVEEITGGHKVIIKDINGTKEILVMDGEDAVSPVITTSKEGRVTTITITDAEGVKTIPISDGKDAVSPIVSMTKEDGIITIRVEDAEGIKEESVQEGITKHNVPEFIGTLENPIDFSDLFENIANDRYHTGFCILGGYFKVTDWDKNDLGVKHWQEIFSASSGVTLHYVDTLLVTYTYRKTPLSAFDSQVEFTFVVDNTLYTLYGFTSYGIIEEYSSSKIATSNDLANYYKKTETYSRGETDTKIAEAVANIEIPDACNIPKLVGTEENPIDFSELYEKELTNEDGSLYTTPKNGKCIIEGVIKSGSSSFLIYEFLIEIFAMLGIATSENDADTLFLQGNSFVIDYLYIPDMLGNNILIKFDVLGNGLYLTASVENGLEQIIEDLVKPAINQEKILFKDNTTAYTPTAAYNPATKQYVDEKFVTLTQAEYDALVTAGKINENTIYLIKEV